MSALLWESASFHIGSILKKCSNDRRLYRKWKQKILIQKLKAVCLYSFVFFIHMSRRRVGYKQFLIKGFSSSPHRCFSVEQFKKKSGICSMIWKRCPYYICDTGNMHLHTNICKYDYQILLIDTGMELHCLFWCIKTNLSEPRFACHVYPRCREQQISVRERMVFSSASEIHSTVLSGLWI